MISREAFEKAKSEIIETINFEFEALESQQPDWDHWVDMTVEAGLKLWFDVKKNGVGVIEIMVNETDPEKNPRFDFSEMVEREIQILGETEDGEPAVDRLEGFAVELERLAGMCRSQAKRR